MAPCARRSARTVPPPDPHPSHWAISSYGVLSSGGRLPPWQAPETNPRLPAKLAPQKRLAAGLARCCEPSATRLVRRSAHAGLERTWTSIRRMAPAIALFLTVLVASQSATTPNPVAPISTAPHQAAPTQAAPVGGSARAVFVAADGTERAVPVAAFEIADVSAFVAALVRFERGGSTEAQPVDLATLELAGGEILCGAITGGQGEHVDVELACGVNGGVKDGLTVRADLERMHALRFESRVAGAAGIGPAAEGDRIYRVQSNGVERIDGAVEGFTEGGVRFHGALVGTIAIPWRNVAALYVEHLGSKPPRMDAGALPVVLDLEDGSRLAGILLGTRDRAIELNRLGSTLRVPISAVLQLARDDGSVAFLSAIAPKSIEPSRPFGDDLGMVWHARMDRTVSGGALRVGGTRRPRGIGVHAPSRSTWALDGSFGTLRGSVALDDEVMRLATRGSCVFRVLLDGREAFASPVVRAGDPALAFKVELTGAKELALVVEPTEDGFAGDRADWLGLVLTRGQAPRAEGSQR